MIRRGCVRGYRRRRPTLYRQRISWKERHAARRRRLKARISRHSGRLARSARSISNSTNAPRKRRYILIFGISSSLHHCARCRPHERSLDRCRRRNKSFRAGSGSASRSSRNCRKGSIGSARADALAVVDRAVRHKTLIVVDLSYDATYAEILFERFGSARHWRANHAQWRWPTTVEHRPVKDGMSRSIRLAARYLLDLLLREMQDDMIRILNGRNSLARL